MGVIVDLQIGDVELKALVRLGITFLNISANINDYYWLLIR